MVHLHNHTVYSLLDGACKIKDIVSKAAELKHTAIAITDHGNMSGALAFYKECKAQNIKPIIGCEVYVVDNMDNKTDRENYHLILLAKNHQGYQNLCKIVSEGFTRGYYYKPRVDLDYISKHSDGLICLSACVAGEISRVIVKNAEIIENENGRTIKLKNAQEISDTVKKYINIFGRENFFLEVQNHGLKEERITLLFLPRIAKTFGLKCVATNDAHYVNKNDAQAHDLLLCIQTKSTVSETERFKFPNDQFYLKDDNEMLQAIGNKEFLDNSQLVADMCNLEFPDHQFFLPNFDVPEGFTMQNYLRHLCIKNLSARYPGDKYQQAIDRLEYELGVIHKMGYDSYFLIVWDFINFCRNNNIPVGPGRGSAAGSIVAYLLDITCIDPLKYKLLFERFLNPDRVSMPDIDTDFGEGREKVIQYVADKYGANNVCQIITFGTMKAKGAIRDIARVLDVLPSEANKLAKMIPDNQPIGSIDEALEMIEPLKQAYETVNAQKSDGTYISVREIIDNAKKIEGVPKSTGVHAAGVIIAPDKLANFIPVCLAKSDDDKEKSVVSQFTNVECEECGLLKMDFLGLITLTVITDTLKYIKQNHNIDIDINNIPLDDAKTYELLCKGETAGVFQLESEGITKKLVELAPDHFEDIGGLVALYRPGPLGAQMDTDFINGRHGNKTAETLHPVLEPILEETYGVVLYQEQVMQIAQVLSGFTMAQADNMRRAMGKKKLKDLEHMRALFVEGAKQLHNVSEQQSNRIYDLLINFAGYGFNKSHSTAYALITYQTAYLKANYPAEFMCATLNSVIGKNDKVMSYINVCRNMGIKILPPDINASNAKFSADQQGRIRFGFQGIKSVGSSTAEDIMKNRQEGEYTTILDCFRRANIGKSNAELLIRCGAFDSFGYSRRQLIEGLPIIQKVVNYENKSKDFISLFDDFEPELVLPETSPDEIETILNDEKNLLGFYISGHPLDKYSIPSSCTEIDKLPLARKFLSVAGIVTSLKIFSTRKGEQMASGIIEDYSGILPFVVFPSQFNEALPNLIINRGVVLKGYLRQDDTGSSSFVINDTQLLNLKRK